MNGLYNKGVYFPKELEQSIIKLLACPYVVHLTAHGEEKIEKLHLPKGCYKAMLNGEVVEAEVENNNVTKIITRIQNRYNPKQDICGAIVFGKNWRGCNVATVKTIWTNAHDDDHKTIKVENYAMC